MKIPGTSGEYDRTIDEFVFNGEDVELALTVSYEISPYWTRTWDYPGDDPTIDDLEVKVTGVTWFAPDGERLDRTATSDELIEVQRLVDAMDDLISDDEIFDHADGVADWGRECAAEAKEERRRERIAEENGTPF